MREQIFVMQSSNFLACAYLEVLNKVNLLKNWCNKLNNE